MHFSPYKQSVNHVKYVYNNWLSFQAEFIEGKMHYSTEKFAPAIEHFEAAVKEYFTAYEECRVLCEGAFNYDNYMEYNADLFQAMTGWCNSVHLTANNKKTANHESIMT